MKRIAGALVLVLLLAAAPRAQEGRKRLLYVAVPGIRNLLEYGGAGVLVYDIDAGHALVRRIKTNYMDEKDKPDAAPENVKGVCACAKTKRLYVTTITRMACIDLATEKQLWVKRYPDGCDRMSISPDGALIYVPTFEKDHWNVVDGATGELTARIETKSGAHNTVYGADGKRVYMGGLKSPMLFVADTATHLVCQQVGPFGGAVRPFTVNAAQTLAYVCVNGLLGFEIGDLKTGKLLHRVEVPGFKPGPVKRHGCPSHGVGLTPDEKEVWVVDGFNQQVHFYDNTSAPPKYVSSLKVSEEPGWVTFSIDGQYGYPSTGEVIDVKTKKAVTRLNDEAGKPVLSEKMVEIDWEGGAPVRNGDQFGVGRAKP
jgi:DNA-binding beta-propeller fold protein YncE